MNLLRFLKKLFGFPETVPTDKHRLENENTDDGHLDNSDTNDREESGGGGGSGEDGP